MLDQPRLSSQAEKMSEILSHYTATFFERDTEGQLTSTHLMTNLESQKGDQIPSEKFVKIVRSLLPEHGACGVSLSFRSLNPHERISVKRAVAFIAKSGFYHLQVMPAETDIRLQRVTQLFLRDYASRANQLVTSLIHPHSGDSDAMQNLITWLGKQMAEEIASGTHYLRDAAIVDRFAAEESDFDEDILFQPQLIIKYDCKTDLLSTPLGLIIGTPSFSTSSEVDLPPEKSENIRSLLSAVLDFSQSLLASVQAKFIEERLDGASQDTITEIAEKVPQIIGTSISLRDFQTEFDTWIQQKYEEAQDAREIKSMLKTAQVRVNSFLSAKWCSSYLEESIKIIETQNHETLMNFITKTYTQEGEAGAFAMNPEILIRLAQTDIDSRMADRMSQEQVRFIKSVRSALKSRLIEKGLLDDFLNHITPEAVRLANTGTPFDISNNSSRFLNALDRFKKGSEVALKASDAIRQSISDAAGRLNQLEPRNLIPEDMNGLHDYLFYWLGIPSGGSLLTRATIFFLLEKPEIIVADLDFKKGFSAIYAQESWDEESLSEKSLFGALSKYAEKTKQM